MKFIYFYCSHFKGKNPTSRKGNYFEDMKAKLKEVLEISKEKNVDCILHGGDFTDSPVIALNLIDEIVDMIEEQLKAEAVKMVKIIDNPLTDKEVALKLGLYNKCETPEQVSHCLYGARRLLIIQNNLTEEDLK